MSEVRDECGLRTWHHSNDKLYCKQVVMMTGEVFAQHFHSYDHLSVLVSGCVELDDGNCLSVIHGPETVNIPAGVRHEVRALAPSVWLCIHSMADIKQHFL